MLAPTCASCRARASLPLFDDTRPARRWPTSATWCSERLCALPAAATDSLNGSLNAATQWLERSPDDSANRRLVLPTPSRGRRDHACRPPRRRIARARGDDPRGSSGTAVHGHGDAAHGRSSGGDRQLLLTAPRWPQRRRRSWRRSNPPRPDRRCSGVRLARAEIAWLCAAAFTGARRRRSRTRRDRRPPFPTRPRAGRGTEDLTMGLTLPCFEPLVDAPHAPTRACGWGFGALSFPLCSRPPVPVSPSWLPRWSRAWHASWYGLFSAG